MVVDSDGSGGQGKLAVLADGMEEGESDTFSPTKVSLCIVPYFGHSQSDKGQFVYCTLSWTLSARQRSVCVPYLIFDVLSPRFLYPGFVPYFDESGVITA